MLEPHWGPAREVRDDQPFMVIEGPPSIAPDPLVREVEPVELPILYPACVAMYTEEVGVPPQTGPDGTFYRSRVAELIRAGRAFARIEDGRVVFKAEVGSVGSGVCQIQGVWVDPECRGRGLAAPGMAAVVELARQISAGGDALRERVQPAGAGGVRAGRVPHDRDLRDDPVLILRALRDGAVTGARVG